MSLTILFVSVRINGGSTWNMKGESLQARIEITPERNSHGLCAVIDPIVLPLIVAMGSWNTATKRDQHEMEINLH